MLQDLRSFIREEWRAVLFVSSILIGLVLGLVIVALYTPDRGACLHSDTVLVFIPMMPDGKTVTMVPVFSTVCDTWQYPEGRPHAGRYGY